MPAEAAPLGPFALLDDRRAGMSRLYTAFVLEHRCDEPAQLAAVWAAVEADQRRGLHAVLLADYEWGARLQGAGAQAWSGEHAGGPGQDRDTDGARDNDHHNAGALRVLMFQQLQHLDAAATDAWLQQHDGGHAQPSPAGVLGWQPEIDEAGYTAMIDAVQAAIRAGETYQVNATFRVAGSAHGSPLALFRRLRARQSVAFSACVALPGPGAARHVLSMSPELFLQHEAGVLTARPMKGTAPREGTPEQDAEAASRLQRDVKNRAENLMIVDLLRNDLGRIADIGSVKVPALFAIEAYSTVFQMTSTVQARLKPGLGMPQILKATFPCGSITGAPKHHTMDLIRGYEHSPRGLYCGAIGWVDAPGPDAPAGAPGAFCLNVAIRTLVLEAPRGSDGLRPVKMGLGAGIVLDSVGADEWQECLLKGRFATDVDPGFTLFETMKLERQPDGAVLALRLYAHLARLARSAAALGFAFDADAAVAALRGELDAAQAEASDAWRLRLDLSFDGALRTKRAPMMPLAAELLDTQQRVGLCLASQRLPAQDALRAHKTSHRQLYDQAIAIAEAAGAFDALFLTEDGRVAEGARSSVLVRQGDVWWTPPVADSALPGVMRADLLASGLDGLPVRERSLRWPDVAAANELAVCNALRGVLRARWVGPTP